jgi:O-antigen ligase
MNRVAHVARLCGAGALIFLGLSLPASLAFSSLGLGFASICAVVVLATDSDARSSLYSYRWIALGLAVLVSSYVLSAALSERALWKKIADELWTRLLLFVPMILIGSKPQWLRRNLHWMLASATLVALFAISQHFHGRDIWRGGTVNHYGDLYQSVGFFGHHLSYGGHVMVMALVALSCVLHRPARIGLWVALSLVFLLALAWSFSRSSQVGFLAGAAFLVLFSPLGKRRWKFLAFAATIALAMLLPDVRERSLSLFDVTQEPTRINLWRSSLDAFLERPFLGYGPGNFNLILRDFRVSGFYDSTAHAHNDYLMLLLNGGLLSLVAFAFLMIAIFRRLSPSGGRNAVWVLGARACWVAILVAGIFQFYQADDEVEFALFYVLGHALALSAGGATASEESPAA